MGKKIDKLFADFKEFDYDKQLEKFRIAIGEDKANSSGDQDYFTWRKGITDFYSNYDPDKQEEFKWAIKTELSYLDNAKDAMSSVTMPILLLLVPVFVTYIMSSLTQNPETSYYPFIALALSVFYSIFSMGLVLNYSRKSTVEKRFCEAVLDIIQ